MDGDLILEDITTGKTFLLAKDSQPVSCGRSKANQIVTPSLLASRTHCVFARNPRGLNVIDMGGANGIYINGIHQKDTRIPLKINDFIGLGCSDTEPSPSPIKTIYRLKLAEPKKDAINPSSAEHSAVEVQSSTANTGGKRRNSKDLIDCKLSIKKIKSEEAATIVDVIDITEDSNHGISVVPDDWNRLHTSFAEPFAQRNVSVIKFEPPTEASTSRESDASARLFNGTDASVATTKYTSSLHDEIMESQDEDKGHSRDKSRDTKTDEQRSSATINKRKSSSDTESRGEDDPMESKRWFTLPVDPPTTLAEHSNSAISSIEQAIILRRLSADFSSDEEIDILRREGLLDDESSVPDDESSHRCWENFDDFSISGYNADDAELQSEMKIVVPTSNDAVVEQEIKYEPEFHIIDNDESLYMDVNHYSQSLPPTPLKLKRIVKPEPITSYSQFDVVELSDDEDDVFPASQLFGDDEGTENESKVKIEIEMGYNEENEREMVDRRRNDSPALIDVSDSEEEEDNPWYHRLLKAELNASRESIIQTREGTEIENAARQVSDEADYPMSSKADTPMACKVDSPMSREVDSPMSREVDTPMSPEADTPMACKVSRKVDSPMSREVDTPMSPEADTPMACKVSRKVDSPMSREVDTPMSPEADTPMSPEADTPTSPVADTPMSPEADTPTSPVADTPMSPEADTPASSEVDTPMSRQVDTLMSREVDTPMSREVDPPMSPEADTPMSPEADTPMSPEADIPMSPEPDIPMSPEPDIPMSPKANTPMSPAADTPMSSEADTPMSSEADTPMSPPEETMSTFLPHEAKSTTLPQEIMSIFLCRETASTFLSRETTSTFLPRETTSTFLPRETTWTFLPRETTSTFLPRETTSTFLPRETSPMSDEADIPMSPSSDSECINDIAVEIHELFFATDKKKTEKTPTHKNKEKRKKDCTKNLEKPEQRAVEPVMKKVVQENRSNKDDSMSKAKSSDSKKHHKDRSHRHEKPQSIDRSADSDAAVVKDTKKSKSRKHDDEKRRHSSDAKGASIAGSNAKKRDSTEKKSNRTKTAHITDSSNKKRDSTKEKPNVRTKTDSITDNENKKRYSTEEKSNHRTETDRIADIRNNKRHSTEEKSNHGTETDRIADIRNNKRERSSTGEKFNVQTRTDNIADCKKKKRDSTEETSSIRTKIDGIGDSRNKKRNSTEGESDIRAKTDSIVDNRTKKHDFAEEKSDRQTKTPSINSNKQNSMDDKTKHRAESSVRSKTAVPVVLLTKMDHVRKSVPIVEAPIIGNNQRRGVSCNVKIIDINTSKPDIHSPSTSGARTHETITNKLSPPKERKLSTKERKELEYNNRVEEMRRLKEQKFRRMKNKWADCLPLRKKLLSPVMTREARDELRHERKERLKQIADKKKELAEANAEPPKRVAKAKAKVTQRTRNDFLVEELKDQFDKESANIDRTTGDNKDKLSDVEKRKETTVNHARPPENHANFGPKESANNERTPVENRDKAPDGKKRKSMSSDWRREMTTNDEIPPINTLYFDKNNSDQESEDSLSDVGRESIAIGDTYPGNKQTSPIGKNRKNKSLDLREEMATKDQNVLINGANFYREDNDQESQVLPSQLGKKSILNDAAPVNGVKSPKRKKTRINSLDSGKENAMNGEPRREEPIDNRHIEQSMMQTGVPRALTLQNGTARILEESDPVEQQTLNNNIIYEKESTIASRDPRIKAGKSVKLKSSLKKNHGKMTSKPRVIKRVSFDDLNTKVLLFEINPGNSLRKCDLKSRDTLSAIKNPAKFNRAVTTDCPKLEKFLLRIFEWNPVWLKEQKFMSHMPPPVVDQKKLVPMVPKYETYDEYYKAVEPLMVLELWHGITKDFDDGAIAQNYSMFSVVNNSVTRTIVPSTDINVTTLMIEILVSKKTLQSRSHPVYGDLMFLEYVSNMRGKKVQRWKVFAYVTKLHQTILTPNTHFNDDLRKFVQDPYMLLTLTVMTKPLNPIEMQTNTVNRLATISYLRSNIRPIQALQYLPASPLLEIVLNPKIEDYQLPHVGNLESYPLVTKDNLNAKQLEAVARVTEAVIQELPKICLIKGPPGTGKTKVIVNLITQILYGRPKNPNKKSMGILVCAPSNTAIDEIVLKLLDIRSTFPKGNRFNMVRIGRDHAMHPSVKEVSLTELAKKNVKSMTDIYTSPDFPAECLEEEKHRLEARKNSLELELATGQNLDPARIKQIKHKLGDLQVNYDVLMNRQSAKHLDAKEALRLQRASENTLLKRADVMACTLTSCYTDMMESIFVGSDATISVCIVDEANQSIEAETFVPLMLGVKTLVLVGDTNQLPAIVLSQKAKQLGLDQSLFARVQQSFDGQENNPIILLDTQYRMSYPVAYWPNRYFYAGALKNSESLRNLPSNFYKVINLDSTQDINKFTNTNEAHFVANLVYTIMAQSNWDNTLTQVTIGIITPYNDQKTLVAQKIGERIAMLPEKTKKKFIHEVNTVDGFQGQERDIVIMSCVRSNGIGFLSDRQRLCVALTRAKNSLIVCGNFTPFKKNPMWNALLSDAKKRGVYLNMRSRSEVDEITKNIFR